MNNQDCIIAHQRKKLKELVAEIKKLEGEKLMLNTLNTGLREELKTWRKDYKELHAEYAGYRELIQEHN